MEDIVSMSVRTRDIWLGLLWRGCNVVLFFLGYFMTGILDVSVSLVETQAEDWAGWIVLNLVRIDTLLGFSVIAIWAE